MKIIGKTVGYNSPNDPYEQAEGESRAKENGLKEIELQSAGAGAYRAIVPVTFGTSSAPIHTQTTLTVSGDTARSGKNRRRVMTRVMLDYKALTFNENHVLIVDEKRSNSELSAHVVVSMPKAMEDDLLAKNGAESRAAAAMQLATLLRTLVGTLGAGYTCPVVFKAPSNPNPQVAEGGSENQNLIEFQDSADFATIGVKCRLLGTSQDYVAAPSLARNEEFQRVGFDLRFDTQGAQIDDKGKVNDLANPLTRGLNGLPPFGVDTIVPINTAATLPY